MHTLRGRWGSRLYRLLLWLCCARKHLWLLGTRVRKPLAPRPWLGGESLERLSQPLFCFRHGWQGA
eukprot:6209896-Alexandrium_andersonii.AAC.1